ncbi:MAG: NAD(P)-dependent alcohol dehydrogenase [Lachnospiraceae bacterium]|nr:NAD(P)-dependent alcohol dehydrogenase [Lachnospiraceae bacterium]MCI9134091.1 NAD(P)-dependent alcohol dehydrogenase [Lachnospiraceae bacterium]
MKIQAAVVHEAGQPFQIEEVELAGPKEGELLVKIVASGVCHTDEVAQKQIIPVPLPAVFGHEGCGIVEEVGEGVKEFKKGDRVGFSFGFCNHCENCLSAHQHACMNFNEINFGGVMADGTKRLSQNGVELSAFFGQSSFATYAVVHENSAIKVEDEEIDLALVGPLGCGIQTGAGAVLNRLRPAFGSSIAVFGCGTVGMSAIMAAKIAGCDKIVAVGGNAKSLELALELGATHTINRRECEDIVKAVRDLTGGGAHYSIDTTGVGDFVKKALASVRFMGTCVVLGATGDLTINVQEELMGDAKSLIGVVEGDSIPKLFIPKLLEYYKKGQFPFDRLIQFYDFKDINQAFEDSHNGKVIKAVLKM